MDKGITNKSCDSEPKLRRTLKEEFDPDLIDNKRSPINGSNSYCYRIDIGRFIEILDTKFKTTEDEISEWGEDEIVEPYIPQFNDLDD